MRAFKKRFVERALEASGGDYAAAAKRLGVNAKYVYQLVKNLEEDED